MLLWKMLQITVFHIQQLTVICFAVLYCDPFYSNWHHFDRGFFCHIFLPVICHVNPTVNFYSAEQAGCDEWQSSIRMEQSVDALSLKDIQLSYCVVGWMLA